MVHIHPLSPLCQELEISCFQPLTDHYTINSQCVTRYHHCAANVQDHRATTSDPQFQVGTEFTASVHPLFSGVNILRFGIANIGIVSRLALVAQRSRITNSGRTLWVGAMLVGIRPSYNSFPDQLLKRLRVDRLGLGGRTRSPCKRRE